MESNTSQSESETPIMAYHFVSNHATFSKGKKEFQGAGFINGAGPSLARCQPIENNTIVIDKDGQVRAPSALPATIIFKMVKISDYYASCSLGIHTNVKQFFTRGRSRNGYEVSVHGHRVSSPRGGRGYRESEISKNVKQTKNASENAKDWMDKEWTCGDVIKLQFTNPFLRWFWNGIEQSTIDVSDENYRILYETLQGNSNIQNRDDEPHSKKRKDGNTEDVETKWCFYVRGMCSKVHIKDKDLTEKEYEELRNSYADRLKVMNDKKTEQGPCDDWDNI